ncbi:MAG TPA: hypothetical protein VIL61_09140 [Nitrospiria bacterium]
MATQTTFVDPTTTVPTDPAPANTGNGTISTPVVSSATLTENFTVTCQIGGGTGVAQFSVVGSVSGNIGTAIAGTEFIDANKKVRFTITAGGTPFAVGDDFAFNTTAGTPLNKTNFDGHAAPMCAKADNNNYTADQLPNADDAVKLGSVSKRWSEINVVTSNVGDLNFLNGWTITEDGDDLLFLNPKRRPVLRLNVRGRFMSIKTKRRKR